MVESKRSTGPAVDDNGNRYATLAWIAGHINRRFPPKGQRRPVSRQLLHKSWTNREHNRFPEPVVLAGSAGRGRALFNVDAVVAWYVDKRHYRIEDVIPPNVIAEHDDDDDGESALAA